MCQFNLSLQPLKKQKRGSGVIGSRTRLRIWRREAWGFESLLPHSVKPGQSDRVFCF
jgi:hypothetical protein